VYCYIIELAIGLIRSMKEAGLQLKSDILAIERRPLYEQVAENLRKYIIQQNLQPGDKLPSEDELAEMFGVGRSSVREAVKSLSVLGVVEIRRREGTVVKNVDPIQFIDNMAYGLYFSPDGLRELHQLRLILELGLVQYIGGNEKLRARTVASLEKRLQEMEAAISSTEQDFVAEDVRFHETLFRCVDSEVTQRFVSVVGDFFVQSERVYGLNYYADKQRRILDEHREITSALAQGDLAGATKALTKHFAWFNEELKEDTLGA
jgi:GntR family transcriptional repressor for pyruvate dehydrogenase complex